MPQPRLARHVPLTQASSAISFVLLTCWTGAAHATDSAAAAAAVARLLALPTPGHETAVATHHSVQHAKVTTLRGENLDRVIRRSLPNLPFKDDFLRKAFVQLNPDVLGKNQARAMPTGTVLVVPSPQDLAALLSEHYPALGHTSATVQEDGSGATSPSKRRWVQYP